MQIFVSTTSLGCGRTDLVSILPVMMNFGLDGIELGSTHIWRPDLARIVNEYRPRRILAHNYFPPAQDDLIINIASADKAVRQSSIAHARYCIDFAAELGAELYTVHPGFMAAYASVVTKRSSVTAFDFDYSGASVPYEEAYELMRDALGELLAHARRQGIRLAIETEGSITSPGLLMMEQPDEYRRLLAELGDRLYLNFNLAHSSLAAKVHGFSISAFIAEFGQHFAAVEISHNDGMHDSHQALVPDSYVFKWLPFLPDVPLILEFREASVCTIKQSAEMLLAKAPTKLQASGTNLT